MNEPGYGVGWYIFQVLFVAFGTLYPTGITALSGICLQGVKHSDRRGGDRITMYIASYFIFIFFNCPVLLPVIAGYRFPYYFYGIVTVALLVALRCSKPGVRTPMYRVALLAFIMCALQFGVMYYDDYVFEKNYPRKTVEFSGEYHDAAIP